jgi:hypothetical protein
MRPSLNGQSSMAQLKPTAWEGVSSGKMKLKIANPPCYSSAAWMKNFCDALSYSMLKTFGLQHVWQSSM